MAVTGLGGMRARVGYRLKIGLVVIVIMVLGFFNESQGKVQQFHFHGCGQLKLEKAKPR